MPNTTMPSASEPAAHKPNETNAEKGERNLAKLVQWLDDAEVIPSLNGTVNISAIAVATGLRRAFCTAGKGRAAIDAAAAKKKLGTPAQQRAPGADAVPAWATQRIKDLEEQLTVAQAEARALREKVARFGHMERHLTDTGMLAR